eukprot:TRINITY_DN5736_c0_g1_i1.p1 TRINITY_DN5736_c0_g1~~TRINITY_DN5736_c0_g1_i1.p1  ORF type:complete len:172 (+),score=27.75 TRINITY_DN5736_c0_g1_i1:25-516(+)
MDHSQQNIDTFKAFWKTSLPLNTGSGSPSVITESLTYLHDDFTLYMEDSTFTKEGLNKFFHYIHSSPLYSEYHIDFISVFSSGDKVGFHMRQTMKPVPGKKFPNTEYVMNDIKKPLDVVGVVTMKDGKLYEIHMRGDSLRRAMGVPGDYLDEKSYMNQFKKNS